MHTAAIVCTCYNGTRMKKKILRIVIVLVGTLILAAGVELFILPYNILSGGVAGIAVLLQPFLHVDKTLTANILVIVLMFVGLVILGKKFFLDTVLSSVTFPIFTWMFSFVDMGVTIEPLLASFYGGLICGVGVGMVMRTGASTGGMDIPSLVLHKITGVRVSVWVLLIDSVTVLLGVLVYDVGAVLLGLISVFASSYAINKILTIEGTVSKSVQIISEDWEKIVNEINNSLGRGTTLTDAEGGYTHQPKKVILCVVSQSEYNKLIELTKAIDPKAFIITTDATDMHGEGFSFNYRI